MAIRSLKNNTFSRSLLVGNEFYVPPAYDSIATISGTGSSSTITFSSIPSTYEYLQIRGVLDTTNGSATVDDVQLRFNLNSSSYAYHYLYGDGTNRGAGGNSNNSNIYMIRAGAGNVESNNAVTPIIIDIYDYKNTSKNTTANCYYGLKDNTTSTNYGVWQTSGVWQNTSLVTSISFTVNTVFFSTATKLSLYGIKGE